MENILHFGQAKEVPGTYKQSSYTDEVTIAVPFSGKFDLERMKKAARARIERRGTFSFSSVGSATMTNFVLDPNNPNQVLITKSISIGD